MRTRRRIPPLTMSADERETLERWTRRASTANARAACAGDSRLRGREEPHARGARAVSHEANRGKVAEALSDPRLDGLLDEPRPGAPRTVTDADVEAVLTRTLETKPADATQWSTRSMARACGLSRTTVRDYVTYNTLASLVGPPSSARPRRLSGGDGALVLCRSRVRSRPPLIDEEESLPLSKSIGRP